MSWSNSQSRNGSGTYPPNGRAFTSSTAGRNCSAAPRQSPAGSTSGSAALAFHAGAGAGKEEGRAKGCPAGGAPHAVPPNLEPVPFGVPEASFQGLITPESVEAPAPGV